MGDIWDNLNKEWELDIRELIVLGVIMMLCLGKKMP